MVSWVFGVLIGDLRDFVVFIHDIEQALLTNCPEGV
jgi:hypothetical protein